MINLLKNKSLKFHQLKTLVTERQVWPKMLVKKSLVEKYKSYLPDLFIKQFQQDFAKSERQNQVHVDFFNKTLSKRARINKMKEVVAKRTRKRIQDQKKKTLKKLKSIKWLRTKKVHKYVSSRELTFNNTYFRTQRTFCPIPAVVGRRYEQNSIYNSFEEICDKKRRYDCFDEINNQKRKVVEFMEGDENKMKFWEYVKVD